MKQSEFKPCAICRQGVMHTKLPLFWRLTVERMGVDLMAIRQQYGLELMIGNPAIASALSSNPDIAKPLTDEGPDTLLVCENCMTGELLPIVAATEKP